MENRFETRREYERIQVELEQGRSRLSRLCKDKEVDVSSIERGLLLRVQFSPRGFVYVSHGWDGITRAREDPLMTTWEKEGRGSFGGFYSPVLENMSVSS